MKVVFASSFVKSLKKIKDTKLLEKIELVIKNVKLANSINEISNLKKLTGHQTYFRIKINDYRIGIEIIDELVDFVQFQHRKDIYNKFP